MLCKYCESPLLEIFTHKACEACGWHTEGFEKLRPPQNLVSQISGEDTFVGLVARQSKVWEDQFAQIFRATIGGPYPEPMEQKWRRVVAFQEKWITRDKSMHEPVIEILPLERAKAALPDGSEARSETAIEITPPPKEDKEDDVAERVRLAMEEPTQYPMMRIAEAAHALQKTKSTIHRLKNEGKIQGRDGRILTESLIAYMNIPEAD